MRARFMEEAICQKEARLLAGGALAVESGRHLERAVNSRYIVRDERTDSTILWSDFNKPMDSERASEFLRDLQTHLASNRAFEVRGWAGPMPIEFQTTSAWHAVFCETYLRGHFIESVLSQASAIEDAMGTLRIWHDPNTRPGQYEISSPDDAFILIDPTGFNIAIVGTALAAEIVDAIFFLLSERLPQAGLLPLRASATCTEQGTNTTFLIGASGTARTDASLRSDRFLISEDHVLWSDHGLSNLSGGCYAKLEALTSSPERIPILDRFGTLLENAAISERSRLPDFGDVSRLRTARACFDLKELSFVYSQSREADQPSVIVLFANDPSGALPLAAKLDGWQFRYHYLMSLLPPFETHDSNLRAALGSTFQIESLPCEASFLANTLAKKAELAGSRLWLLNTGSCERFAEDRTAELLKRIENGQLEHGPFQTHPVFGFEVPFCGFGLETGRFASQGGAEVEALARHYMINQNKFTDPAAHEIFERGGLRIHQTVEIGAAETGSGPRRIAYPN